LAGGVRGVAHFAFDALVERCLAAILLFGHMKVIVSKYSMAAGREREEIHLCHPLVSFAAKIARFGG
jgi:hypothetical protein